MKRAILGAAVGSCAFWATAPAMAFCGLWDAPVALGFDAGAWGEKWPVLAAILLFVGAFSSLVLRLRARIGALGADA
ncbi:hypothetical protein P6F26_14850 [Roseibacterium sp. SDUM158017]|uniref:hypothetical protein n=1 Tax=Roseicyclus salinarum TaxID=3036773 RepID=UPI002415656D|nr:hypothetical protein [Roseibacterium sp. SDUM158017]MDG4649721.1 hypothetical protein [Roseibacterium sp. SDUM158017]